MNGLQKIKYNLIALKNDLLERDHHKCSECNKQVWIDTNATKLGFVLPGFPIEASGASYIWLLLCIPSALVFAYFTPLYKSKTT